MVKFKIISKNKETLFFTYWFVLLYDLNIYTEAIMSVVKKNIFRLLPLKWIPTIDILNLINVTDAHFMVFILHQDNQ